MDKETIIVIIKTTASVIAMVLVGLLAFTALRAGIDGAMFFGAVAVISGLGGYEVKNIITLLRLPSSKPK